VSFSFEERANLVQDKAKYQTIEAILLSWTKKPRLMVYEVENEAEFM
jgi:hypothetical protein